MIHWHTWSHWSLSLWLTMYTNLEQQWIFSQLSRQLRFCSQPVSVGSWLLSVSVKQELRYIAAWHASLIPRNSFLWEWISINPHRFLKKAVGTNHFNHLFLSLTESEHRIELPGRAILSMYLFNRGKECKVSMTLKTTLATLNGKYAKFKYGSVLWSSSAEC